ncbi:MAG: hypothetical protein KKH88_04150 [Nanoarchaeota archaeon]|nr:hypothetical protein [Nanoarchaeota archaeon]
MAFYKERSKGVYQPRNLLWSLLKWPLIAGIGLMSFQFLYDALVPQELHYFHRKEKERVGQIRELAVPYISDRDNVNEDLSSAILQLESDNSDTVFQGAHKILNFKYRNSMEEAGYELTTLHDKWIETNDPEDQDLHLGEAAKYDSLRTCLLRDFFR